MLDLWKEKNMDLDRFIIQQRGSCLASPNAPYPNPVVAYRIRISIAREGLV